MELSVVIVWLRRDLRIEDNAAFSQALKTGLQIMPVFIFDKNILMPLSLDDKRVSFIYQAITSVNLRLRPYRKGIRILYGDPVKVFDKLVSEMSVKAVYAGSDYEPYAAERDDKVRSLLESRGISFITCKEHVIFEKEEIRKADSAPYTVFTPYKNKWLQQYEDLPGHRSYETDQLISRLMIQDESDQVFDLKEIGFKEVTGIYKPFQLNSGLVQRYHETRNFPAIATTSIGVHLRFGTVSIRKIVEIARQLNTIWFSELIWREFFSQILWNFPYVANAPFRKQYERIPWRNDYGEFSRWCTGDTGYPMVDAGMRELNATGFMHNRVRMVTASFLSKHLLIDWRWGEAYFASKLLDFDLASNNGNWQWAAGTGCDAAPYFRVFNPDIQSKKYDPQMEYVKKWVPELGLGHYPKPMVEHEFARNRCLSAYKSVFSSL